MQSTTALPRTITHPLIGDTVTFLKTAEDTGGAFALVEVTLLPNGGTGLHYHLNFIEELTAIEGVLGIRLGKKILHLQTGRKAVAPERRLLRFFNAGTAPVKFRVNIAPARHFEQMLRISFGLAADGLCNKKGIPRSVWHLAILFEMGETYVPGIALGLQKGIFGMLASIARRKGKDRDLERYYKPPVARRTTINSASFITAARA